MAVFTAGMFEYSTKRDGTPGIPVEEAVEEHIRNVLARDRPDDGFLGEEGGQSGDPSTCWIVDPIDGTRVFIHGGTAWATQIALQVSGELTLGVTSAPALGSRWWGAAGQGAWMSNDLSGKRSLKVSSGSTRERLRWSCHPPLDAIHAEWRRLAAPFHEIGDYVAPTPHAVLMVMEGLVEVSLQLKGAAWDYAAFAATVHAAGGRFSYLDASTALGGIRPALFTNGSAHDEAIAALA
jgi:histidinol-phosphatase